MSTAAVRALADEILLATEVLRLKLDGLGQSDSDLAEKLLEQMMTVLSGESRSAQVSALARIGAASLTPAEELIVDYLCSYDEPQSIDEIFEFVSQQENDLKKPTLSVRLHRMSQSNKITNPSRGTYSVSEFVRARRQNSHPDDRGKFPRS